mmetsp:Transcript_43083/g.79960  ORF Transcript_43083/g.79960 Transcript_43083/m.79960 type:complete len:120 (-) Transcript_43083:121-480(-)
MDIVLTPIEDERRPLYSAFDQSPPVVPRMRIANSLHSSGGVAEVSPFFTAFRISQGPTSLCFLPLDSTDSIPQIQSVWLQTSLRCCCFSLGRHKRSKVPRWPGDSERMVPPPPTLPHNC